MFRNYVHQCLLFIGLALCSGLSYAIPALQLGPGTDAGWSYDNTSETWVLNGMGSLTAYANSDGPLANGDYAWDAAGAATQIGYLVVAATPQAADATDIFDITVTNDGSALTLFDSGFGNPPIEDPNSMAGHGIFDTYFEIYQFNFDGMVETILNTQPGDNGSGEGYSELFNITLNSVADGVEGLHFDLFSIIGDGLYNPGDPDNKKLMKAAAPFSHDAQMNVPEPGTVLLLGFGLLGLFSGRRVAFIR